MTAPKHGFNLTLFHKALILVVLPLAFEAVFFGTLLNMLHQAEVEGRREQHAKEVMLSLNQLMGCLMDGTRAIAMYVALRQEDALNKYLEVVRPVPEELARLRTLLKDEPGASKAMDEFDGSVQEVMNVLNDGIALVKGGEIHAGLKRIRETQRIMRALNNYMDAVRARSKAVADQSSELQERARLTMKLILVAGMLFNILLAVSLAFYFNRGTTRRLGLVMDNTRRLAKREPLLPPVGGGDEIAHLDGFFRTMADELETARKKELAVIEHAEDVICSIDSQYKFTKVSPASAKVWGYQPEELIGNRFTKIINEEDIEKTTAVVNQLMTGSESFPFECRVTRRDGSAVDILWSAHWSERDGSLFCVAHDITERKMAEDLLRTSEEKVRLIVESMPVGLVITDKAGTIQLVNPTTLRMFEYDQTQLIGQSLKLLFASSKESTQADFMSEITGKAIGRIYETEAVKQSGLHLPVQVSLTGFQSIDGECYLSVILDITERKEIERLKQEFVAMISHDLRTPLTSIQIFLNMLTKGTYGAMTESGMKKADMADRNATRLINLVNDLLDIEKMESGQLELNRQPSTLAGPIERSVESVRAFAEKNGVTIETEPISTTEILADGDRLVQVITNLLGNAVKFSPSGTSVIVSTAETPDAVTVQIKDHGRGVPAHLRQSIFERFKQVEIKDATEKKGTGLGLAICRAIVEQHGGEIGVDSEEGKGSTFWFRLPTLLAPVASVSGL